MDLKQLETFITVVEWDSFSEAAKRLYLTQPTISTHIKQIENELNAELLKRTTKKLELTPEGREFYNYAKAISRIMESMQDSFSKKSNYLQHRCKFCSCNIYSTFSFNKISQISHQNFG